MSRSLNTSAANWPFVMGNAAAVVALLAMCLALLLARGADDWWVVAPDGTRITSAVVATLAWMGITAGFVLRQRRDACGEALPESSDALLVAWASQTGFAEHLASRTVAALTSAGVPARAIDLAKLDVATLASHPRILFIASTTGEGDAPDHANAFVRGVLGKPLPLPDLRYALLALGDRQYQHFCGFGHRIDDWLRGAGASRLFDLVEVDNGDDGALRQWQHHLGVISGAPELPDWSPARYDTWQLQSRALANAGSIGAEAFHLSLSPPPESAPTWQAGDIAEIGPRNAPRDVGALLSALRMSPEIAVQHDGEEIALHALLSRSHLPDATSIQNCDPQTLASKLQPLPHREYSIASLPQDGCIDLLVRRMQRADGHPGLGSSWLCAHADIGADIALRIRSNRNFHPPEADAPMLLVGNGTGIAGLRAHIKARIAVGLRRNWLLFGERNVAHDRLFGDEIDAWWADGWLARVDLAFSRDPSPRYVQDALAASADALRTWVDNRAAIYVCGSVDGMAPGVDAVLRDVLGGTAVDALVNEGRYRRDVY